MRVNRDLWISAALDTLSTEGHTALSAERLSRKLGVTRGSFYHHFASMDEFHEAVLLHWQIVYTDQMLDQGIQQDALTELNRLIALTLDLSMELENNINAWAGANARVAELVAKVEQRRLNRLIDLYQRICNDNEKGKRLAKIAYYGLLGAAHATPRLSKEELRLLLMEVHELMLSII